jgi:DNA-binding NarL/FixJ family response regulator
MTTHVGSIPDTRGEPAPATVVVARDAVARRRIGSLLERGGYPLALSCADASPLRGDGSGYIAVLVESPGEPHADDVRALRHQLPEASIVSVMRAPGTKAVRRTLDAGADGIVDEDAVSSALRPTIDAVLAGQTVLPRQFRAHAQHMVLSNREKQVLGLVVMGLTNGEIANRMFLAESTVKSHLSSAFAKLGVSSRNEAAAIILDPDSNLGPGIIAITAQAKRPVASER